MSTNVIALLILIAGWTLAAGALKLVANHCRRGIDAATAMNDASRARLDEMFATMRSEYDRAEACNAENARLVARNAHLVDLFVAARENPSAPEVVERRTAVVDESRWN